MGTLTVLPGDTLEVPLVGIDPDGDRVTFSIQSDNPLPTGTLRADNTLVFNPKPEEVGNYSFTLIATDGALTTEQQVTLTVAADPITTTRISGVIQNTDQQPLSGVLIDLGGTQVETAADGSFTLEFTGALPSDTLKVHGEGISGNYPFIAEKLPLLLGHEVYGNVNNVVVRPIYLPPLDVATAQPVDPNADTTITTTTIPGASVFVEAGSLLDQQGNPFTGQLSITEVPTDLTPAALPANLNPDLVVTIQPGEMVFTTPAPLSLPNRAGYAPNTLMDLWSINPITGDFDNVGTGQVSSDGSVIYTIEGGIRNSSWHFFAPPTPAPADDPRNPEEREDCPANCDLTSQAELYSGAVIETHDLVSYQSQGATRGLTLTYDSLRADPRPIVHFGYDNLQANAGGEVVARLAIQNGNFNIQVSGVAPGQYEQTIGGEHFWSLPANGGSISAALQADLSNLDSGQYTYKLTSGIRQFTNQGLFGSSSTTTGKVISVNSVQSIFGSGWGLAGLQELVVNADGSVLLIDGDGSELIFEASTESENAYVAAPGDFSTLERLPDGTFRRTLEDQTVYQFNARNQLELMRDRNGNETRYLYDSTGKLTTIIDPVGLETTLSYSGDRVSTITDPADRTTYLEHDAAGNLIRIINPDETSRTWEYDQKHHMTAETDQRGYREETLYDFAGRATQGIRKDGTIVEVAPVQVQGLYRSDATIDPTNAPVAQQLGAPESLHTDGNGSVIATQLDQAGQTISSADGAGTLPLVQRNGDNLVTRRTDGRGNPTQYVYDEQGNVIEVIDTIPGEGGAGGTQLQFEAQPEYITGSPPAKIISGDWNGDGNLDLATTNVGSSVSIHYGDGEGSFIPGNSYTVSGQPSALITSDVNEDGNFDLLVGHRDFNSSNGKVTVLLGAGDGSFVAGESYVVASGSSFVTSIALEDIDQDGNLDLISGSGYGSDDETVSVLFGQGDGSFITHSEYDAGRNVDFVVTEDVDGDSDLDLITVNTYEDSLSVLLNNGDGSFTSGTDYTVGDSPEAIFTGDVDGNGTLDIVAANSYSNSVSVLFGNGSGLFADRVDYAVGGRPVSVALGDVDGNGILDIVTANYHSDNVSVLLGESNTTLRNRVDFTTVSLPTDVKVQDVDSNGTLDLIVASAYNGNVSVLLGDGNGSFASGIDSTIDSSPDHVVVGDVNEDGFVDLVTADFYAGSVSILLGSGNGSFVAAASYDVAGGIFGLASGDLNGDGHLDLFAASFDTVSILLGNGDGTFRIGRSYASDDGSAIVAADLDGDGNLDLLTANGSTVLSILSGNGDGSLAARGVYPIGVKSAIVVKDVNSDGNFDLIAAESNGSRVSVLLGNGDSSFAPAVDYTVGLEPESLVVEDLNGDGTLDLVTANTDSDSVSVLLGNGDGTFAAQTQYKSFNSVESVVAADVNGDSYLDLVVTNPYDDRVSVLLGAGDGSFGDPIEVPAGSNPFSVIAADVNGDEALDIVTTNIGSSSISVLLNQTDEVQARRSYTYDAEFNQLTSQTDELGRQTLYEIDPETGDRLSMTQVVGTVGGSDDVVTAYSYTEDGQLDTETDPLGRITDYDYDAFGRLVKITFARGTVDEAVQQFEYDAAGNQTAMIDENGDRTEYVYDAMNQLVRTIEPDPDGAGVLVSPETSYTYDEVGNQVTMTDANGNVMYQEYDAMEHLVQVTEADPDGAGALTSPVTIYLYDQSGNQVGMIDPLGRQTRHEYDSRGRLVETIRADGSTIDHLYDVDNNRTGETDANGNETRSVYDSRGRLIQIIDANEQVTTFEYDAANQLIAQTDANGHRMEYRYDDLGRRITVIDGPGTSEETSSSIEYDKVGNVIAETDGLGHETEYVYDNRDRQTQIIDALDDPGITSMTYDEVGNLLSLTDPVDNTTTFTYDALDRLIAEANELNKTRTHAYDANDNRIATVDRNNRTRTFTYDGLNRQVAENWLDSGSAIRTITSAYDAADQLIWVSDPDSTYRFSYDALGRQIGVDNAGTPGVANVDLTYAYDDQGNLISVSDTIEGQAGGTTAYSYDELDRVTQITQNGNGVSDKRVDFTYNPIGQVEAIDRYSDLNGAQFITGTTYTYDPLNRLDLLTHESPTGTTTAFYDFAYDDADRITQIIDVDGTTEYSYNDRNELTGADHTDLTNLDESYSYDKNGNRLNYDTGTNNRLESDGTYIYTYDDEGNLIQQTEIATGNVREFVWDYHNRLVAVVDENASGVETQQVEYTYDVMGRRIVKTIDADGVGGGTATTTHFVYDRDNIILEFTDGSLSQRYLHGTRVDQVLAQENGNGETVWHLTDHLGTVRDLVNDGGAVVNHLTYDSFSTVVEKTGSTWKLVSTGFFRNQTNRFVASLSD